MLRATQLIGFGAGGLREQPNFALVDASSGAAATNTKTFATLNFGVPSVDRYLIAGFHAFDNGFTDSAFSVTATIGGITATVYNNVYAFADSIPPYGTGWSGSLLSGIAIANVPVGNSGDVVFTISGYLFTMDYWGIGLYRAVGLSSPTPTTTPSADNTAVTMNVPTNGFGILAAGGMASPTAFSNNTYLNNAYAANYGIVSSKSVSGSQTHNPNSTFDCTQAATWTFIS